jgi:large subunit ribosomal protein L15
MKLNEIKPNVKAKHNVKRLGRGMGSGKGKTCGKGHKGQKARTGYTKKLHFEGGQMPKQRRLPKIGFVSAKQKNRRTIRLSELDKLNVNEIDMNSLRKLKLIKKKNKFIKIISSGKISKEINIRGIKVTKGVKMQIEKNGGKII